MKFQSILTALAVVSAAVACPAGKKAKTSKTSTSTKAAATTAPAATTTPVVAVTPTTAEAVASTSSTSQAAAATSSSSSSSSSTALSSTAVTGSSTFYGGNTSGGTCSFTSYTIPSGLYGTAFSGSAWDSAAECGACLQVTGPLGTIKVMVVDECPECDAGHLDLFQDAFAKIGNPTDGIISTSYTAVECGITSPIILHNKSGTSAYWFSMQVINSNVPVSKLEVSIDGGSTWTSTTRQDYNFFENSSGFGTSTVDVRVTSSTGKTITVNDVSVASDTQVTAASNF